MEVVEVRESSPNSELSDAPTSDMEATTAAQYSAPQHHITGGNGPVQFDGSGQSVVVAHNAGASNAKTAPATSAPRQGDPSQAVTAKRKPRAKKDAVPADADKPKEKAKRKPRSDKGIPKQPNKKLKLEPAPDKQKPSTPNPIQASVANTTKFQPLPPSSTTASSPHSQNEARPPSRNGLTKIPNVYESSNTNYPLPVSMDPPATSSNMYDPVRAMTVQRPSSSTVPPPPMYQSSYNLQSQSPSPFKPSVSPAISSMVNHPEPWRTGPPTQYRPDGQTHTSESMSVAATQPQPGSSTVVESDPSRPLPQSPRQDTDSKKSPAATENSPAPEKKQRAKEQPPPIPQGSGLLSSTLFGGSSADATASSDRIPNIVLHIELKEKSNNIVNFARIAEEKYGFAALHPRLAAQKERLARVAAVGATLERSASGSGIGGTSAGESGDEDGSVDIDRESGDDGDAHMGGMNNTDGAGNSGTDGPTAKPQRRKKIEEYDQEDPFVDDSEMVWESQAAASKDGFFVYCGPLVPEGEKAAVERFASLPLSM